MAKKKKIKKISIKEERKKAIKKLKHAYYDDELINFQRGKSLDWSDIKYWGDLFGYTPEEVARLILREVNRRGKKITDLPYKEQKIFYDLYTKHDTPEEAFKDEELKKWFKKYHIRISCNSAQVLKKHWTDLNREMGTIKKGNYKKPHNFD